VSDGMNGAARRAIGMSLVVLAGAGAGAARAQDAFIAPGTEAFKLNLGGVVTNNSTSFRLDGTTGRGTDIDLEGLTGLDEGVSTFFASGTWRFAPNHRLSLVGFQIERDRSVNIDRTITIGDTVVPINTNLKTEARTQFFIVNYEYSFIRNESMELAGLLGLYGANFKYKFTANNPLVDIDKSTTAPLPIIGLKADFFISPRWTVSAFGEGLGFKVGDVDGSMYHVGVSTDYMITRNWGVGLGYQLTDLKVDVTKSDFNGHMTWRMDGYYAYLQARF
jgi:outer membrane protein W